MTTYINTIADAWAAYFGLVILQNTLFLGLVFLTFYLLRNADARIKYMIGVLGIIKLLLPPFLPGQLSWFSTPSPAAMTIKMGKVIPMSGTMQEVITHKPSVTAILFLIWTATVLSSLLLAAISTIQLKLRLESAKKLPQNGSRVSLYTSKNIFSPLSIGIFPKRIYVPDYWRTIPEKGQKVLLEHELAHIERRDGLVQFLQTLIQALYFFHPLVWLVNERINEYREMACDDHAVTNTKVTPGDYSRYLVDIAEKITDPQWSYISASALIKQKHKLLNRVSYQLQEGAMQKRSTFKTRAVLTVLALLILPFSWYCSQDNPSEAIAGNSGTSEILNTGSKISTGKIWGVITDAQSSEALPGANIVVAGTSLGAASDKDGRFFIPNMPPGSYTLEFQMMGYKTIIMQDVKVSENQSTKIDCNMEEAVVSLKGEIVVNGAETITVSTGDKKEKIRIASAGDDSPPPPPIKKQKEWNKNINYPQPVGGFEAIQRNIRYPELAIKAGIEGKVVINCLFDVHGNILETKILEDIGDGDNGCAEAAINAVKSVKWEPAKQRGKPIRVWIGIPVVFKLDSKKVK